MKKMNLEMIVGVFLLAGFISFSWLAVKMGDINPFANETYPVTARFTSISGLKEGSTIELAGVVVGKVSGIELDTGDYEAVVHLNIDKQVDGVVYGRLKAAIELSLYSLFGPTSGYQAQS